MIYEEDTDVDIDFASLSKKKDMLVKSYQKATSKRLVLVQLTTICIQLQEFDDAEAYIEELINIAPKDLNIYILNYKLNKEKGRNVHYLISILEELKKYEYFEQWGYELAELYYDSKDMEKCIKECKELILWFGIGQYIDKANELIKKCYTEHNFISEVEEHNFISEVEEQNFISETTKQDYTDDCEEFNELDDKSEYKEENQDCEQTKELTNKETEENITAQEEQIHIIKDELTKNKSLDYYLEVALYYAELQDYTLTDEAKDELTKQISLYCTNKGDTDIISDEIVEEIINKAIEKSEKRNMKVLLNIVNQRSYLDSQLLILVEQDFLDE